MTDARDLILHLKLWCLLLRQAVDRQGDEDLERGFVEETAKRGWVKRQPNDRRQAP